VLAAENASLKAELVQCKRELRRSDLEKVKLRAQLAVKEAEFAELKDATEHPAE
jgi:hypothetical protein